MCGMKDQAVLSRSFFKVEFPLEVQEPVLVTWLTEVYW